jgi:hyperosmotically inducible periplasmic protein
MRGRPMGRRRGGSYRDGIALARGLRFPEGTAMSTHPTTLRRGGAVLLPLLASLSLLGACQRQDDRTDPTIGQRTDQAVASAERKANEVAADVRQAGREARQAIGATADSVANKPRAAAITPEVKARLARDPAVSALAINVDTEGGRVVLRGSAPSGDARSRATELARGVDGVVSVDNDLTVRN